MKKVQRAVSLILAGLLLMLSCAYAEGFSTDAIRMNEAAKSVMFLEVHDKFGNVTGTGSGFVAFDNQHLVTNFHVASEADTIYAYSDAGDPYIVTDVCISDSQKDIAILQFFSPTEITPLALNEADVLRASPVVAIGSPKGFVNSISTGIVSALSEQDGARQIQFTAPISSGSSGGALFNDDGVVIGITTSSYDDGHGINQNLNFAVDIREVSALFASWNGEVYQLSNLLASDVMYQAFKASSDRSTEDNDWPPRRDAATAAPGSGDGESEWPPRRDTPAPGDEGNGQPSSGNAIITTPDSGGGEIEWPPRRDAATATPGSGDEETEWPSRGDAETPAPTDAESEWPPRRDAATATPAPAPAETDSDWPPRKDNSTPAPTDSESEWPPRRDTPAPGEPETEWPPRREVTPSPVPQSSASGKIAVVDYTHNITRNRQLYIKFKVENDTSRPVRRFKVQITYWSEQDGRLSPVPGLRTDVFQVDDPVRPGGSIMTRWFETELPESATHVNALVYDVQYMDEKVETDPSYFGSMLCKITD